MENNKWDKYLHDLKSKSACLEGGMRLLYTRPSSQRKEILSLIEESAHDVLKILAAIDTEGVETLD